MQSGAGGNGHAADLRRALDRARGALHRGIDGERLLDEIRYGCRIAAQFEPSAGLDEPGDGIADESRGRFVARGDHDPDRPDDVVPFVYRLPRLALVGPLRSPARGTT